MKKLLIATTALVGTAGVVAADVTFSGYGRFGIQYDEDRTRTVYSRCLLVGRLRSRPSSILKKRALKAVSA